MRAGVLIEKLAQFTGHSGSIYALHVSAANRRIYTGARDGYVVEWDVDHPEEGTLLCRLDEPVYSLFLYEPRQELWIGVASGHIHVVSLKSKEELKNLEIHQNGVFDFKLINGLLYVAGGDGCISVIDPEKYSLENWSKFTDKSARIIAIHPHNQTMAAGFSDHSIRFFDADLKETLVYEGAHTNSVFSMAFTPDGKHLISGGRDAMLRVWTLEDGLKQHQEIPAHNYHIHCISVHPERNIFLSSSMDKTIKVWSLEDFSLLKVVDKDRNGSHGNSVNKVVWLGGGEFVSIGDDKVAILWAFNQS